MNTLGCGGGGGGDAGGGPAGTTSILGGTVFDPAVRGASVEFFRDVGFTNRMTPRESIVLTRDDGSYAATFDGALPQFVFIRTTGGTDTATNQPAPQLQGVSPSLGTGSLSGRVGANGLGVLLVNELRGAGTPGLPPAANPEEAYARIRSIFTALPANPVTGLDQINATQGSSIPAAVLAMSDAIIEAARATGGTTGGAIVSFGTRLARNDASALNDLRTAAQNRSVTIADPVRFFAVSGLTVGGQPLTVPSVLTVQGDAQFAPPANPIDIAGATRLPTIVLSVSNLLSGGFPDGTVFPESELKLTISGTSGDLRRLVVQVTQARATVGAGGAVAFAIDQGAAITLSGTDANGASVPVIQVVNQGADAITTAIGSTLTFDTDALVNQLRARLGLASLGSTHPASLIGSAGTFQLEFETKGIPLGLSPNANGFSKLRVDGVQVQGQHVF